MPYKFLVEVTRNGTIESSHFGAAVVCDYRGNVLESWGDSVSDVVLLRIRK